MRVCGCRTGKSSSHLSEILYSSSEGICTEFSKELGNLTKCNTCVVEGKCGRKMGSTLVPNRGPRARALLTHLNSFPFFNNFCQF
jgi:hypothetical protein